MIDVMLEQNSKSRYWLAKEVNMSYNALAKLCDGKTESVRFSVLDSVCMALSCKIEDIIEAE